MVTKKRPVEVDKRTTEVAKRNIEVAYDGKVYSLCMGKPIGDIPERIRLLIKDDLEIVKDVRDVEQTD